MEQSIIKQIEDLLNSAYSDSTYSFQGENGEIYSISEANEKGLKGLIVKNTKNKDEILKAIFGKERVADEDLYQIDSILTKLITYVYNNFAYMSQARYLEQYKFVDFLCKYDIKFTFPKKNQFQIDYENEYPNEKISIKNFILSNKEKFESRELISSYKNSNEDLIKKSKKV